MQSMNFKNIMTREQLQAKVPSVFVDTNKESLSEKYLQIPTYKILDGLMNNGFSIVSGKEQRSRAQNREHAKHVIHLTHAKIEGLAVKEGLPMIRIQNSHNGLSSFQISSGFYRLVCSNGLILPESELSSARIKHVKSMENDVIEACYKILTEMPNQMAMIEEMQSITLSNDERRYLAEGSVNLVFDADVIELNKNKIDLAQKLLTTRRYEDKPNTLWNTFNVIQENAIKGGLRIVRESGVRKTKTITSIDADKKINIELMTLAQKMAELKRSVA